TNGLTHFYAVMDLEKECYVFLENIPEYEQ
ncbi:MAG TPA: restriction endonuclease subunit R, partial [Lutibacter sp.]|nr:restriction endonuclease subunit R [Lutibacter sp.]